MEEETKQEIQKIEASETQSLVVSQANEIVITSNEDVANAVDPLVKIRKEKDTLEEKKDSYTKPLNESLKKLNADYKALVEPLEQAEALLKSKIIEFRSTQKEDEDSPSKFEGYEGELRFKKTWDFEIEDETKIPREYLKVDESKIRKAVTAGPKDIPGVKTFQKETPSIYKQ